MGFLDKIKGKAKSIISELDRTQAEIRTTEQRLKDKVAEEQLLLADLDAQKAKVAAELFREASEKHFHPLLQQRDKQLAAFDQWFLKGVELYNALRADEQACVQAYRELTELAHQAHEAGGEASLPRFPHGFRHGGGGYDTGRDLRVNGGYTGLINERFNALNKKHSELFW